MPCIWCILLCKHCKSKDPLLGRISLILFSVLHQLPVCVRYVDLLMRLLSPPSNHGDITRSPHFIIPPVIVQMPTQCTGVQRSNTFKDTSGNYSSSRGTQSKKKTNLNVNLNVFHLVLCKNMLIQRADNQLVGSGSWWFGRGHLYEQGGGCQDLHQLTPGVPSKLSLLCSLPSSRSHPLPVFVLAVKPQTLLERCHLCC